LYCYNCPTASYGECKVCRDYLKYDIVLELRTWIEYEKSLKEENEKLKRRLNKFEEQQKGRKSKFTEEEKTEIRKLIKSGMSNREVAKQYNCDEKTIRNMRN
jgi:DNA-binding NarL/FixJ family response regulator